MVWTPQAHVKIWVYSTHERMIVPAQLPGADEHAEGVAENGHLVNGNPSAFFD